METRSKLSSPIFKAVHPGEILREELKERGIKQKDFANSIGMQKSHLSEILTGNRNITPQIGDKLEQQLNIPSVDWLNLQNQYDYDVRCLKERNIAEQEAINKLNEYNKIFDVRILLKRLHITDTSSPEKLKILVNRCNIKPVAEMQLLCEGAYKKSEKTGTDNRMLMTWMLLAHAASKSINVSGVYNQMDIHKLVGELCSIFHQNTNTLEKVSKKLSEYGIKFCIVEKVNKSSVDGYSFFDKGVPTIIIIKRYNRIDNLAFTVLHEIKHIFSDLTESSNYSHIQIENYSRKNKEEIEADNFAANALIPNEKWKEAPAVKMNSFQIQKDYSRWALNNHFNKWIVLGRISYETGMYKFKDDGTRVIR